MPLAGTVFVLALHGTTPTCEAWTVGKAVMSSGNERVEYHADGDDLVIDARYEGTTSTSCGSKLHVTEHADGYEVDGARWFRTRTACQAAIAHHDHVAMQWPCEVEDDLFADVPATHRRFDDVLAYGGIMYGAGECNRMRFEATKVTATQLEGTLTYAIIADGVHGMEEYGYEGGRGEATLWLLGPGATMEDGSSWAMGCLEEESLGYAGDHVSMNGMYYYFDQASCRAATTRTRYRDSWWPREPDDAAAGRKPLAGGC